MCAFDTVLLRLHMKQEFSYILEKNIRSKYCPSRICFCPYVFTARQTQLCFVPLQIKAVHGIYFFNRTWHNYTVLIFPHVFWEFLFIRINSCHLACFVQLSCCKSCTRLSFCNKNVWGQPKSTCSSLQNKFNQDPLVPVSRPCLSQGFGFWHAFFSLQTNEVDGVERLPQRQDKL